MEHAVTELDISSSKHRQSAKSMRCERSPVTTDRTIWRLLKDRVLVVILLGTYDGAARMRPLVRKLQLLDIRLPRLSVSKVSALPKVSVSKVRA